MPRSPAELAAAARGVRGRRRASRIHCHPRDADGHETLEPGRIAAAVRAHPRRRPRVELSLLDRAVDHRRRRRRPRCARSRSWTERARPRLAQRVRGGLDASWPSCSAARGIGIEAGVWTVADVEALADSGLVALGPRPPRHGRRHAPVVRILVEPPSESGDGGGRAGARHRRRARRRRHPHAPRLHHGVGPATWAVLDAAVPVGRDIRIGFEDVAHAPRRAPRARQRGARHGGGPALLVEPAAVGEHDGLDAVAQAELLQDVRDVGLDRRVADEQLARRSRRWTARAAIRRKHVALARGQLVELRRRRSAAACG